MFLNTKKVIKELDEKTRPLGSIVVEHSKEVITFNRDLLTLILTVLQSLVFVLAN